MKFTPSRAVLLFLLLALFLFLLSFSLFLFKVSLSRPFVLGTEINGIYRELFYPESRIAHGGF